MRTDAPIRVAIACGGTGGHLFPGAAAGAALRARGCPVTLLVSEKEVDRRALASLGWNAPFAALPAVGFSGGLPRAAWGAWRAFRAALRHFAEHPPDVVLGMGGFTSAPAILAARRVGAAALIHDSNAIPGRANRWLAPWVDGAMVGFAEAAGRLRARSAAVTGTPVRPGIGSMDPGEARRRLGLDPARPVLLLMGGSQGASALNRLAPGLFKAAAALEPRIQCAHLCGARDEAAARSAAAGLGVPCVVEAFADAMDCWLGAADAVVSRAGASSLAEFAAAGLPSILIPYPFAADNHQWFNARIFVEAGAAELCAESAASAPDLARRALRLVARSPERSRMTAALAALRTPDAAEAIATAAVAAGENRRARAGGGNSAKRWNPTAVRAKGWTAP